MTWYKELGYKKNPLEIDAFKADFRPIRYEKEVNELVYRLKAGNVVVIEGSDGSGKTTLLREAVRKLGGRGKVMYFDNKQLGRNLNVEELLVGSQGFFRRLSGKKPSNMLLLLDNISHLSKRNSERIKYFFDQNYLLGVVFTTDDYKKVDFSKSMRDRIGKRVIKLKTPNIKEVVLMTKERLGDDLLLSDNVIKKIFGLSRNNVKQHLVNCQAIIKFLVEKNKERITDKEMVDIVTRNDYVEGDNTAYCYSCDEPLEKVRNHWRCPDCETYCLKCGSIVDEEDDKCPECRVKFEDQ